MHKTGKKNHELISFFNKTGEKHGLSFSSQEILRNQFIGLDGIHRKFVMVNEREKPK